MKDSQYNKKKAKANEDVNGSEKSENDNVQPCMTFEEYKKNENISNKRKKNSTIKKKKGLRRVYRVLDDNKLSSRILLLQKRTSDLEAKMKRATNVLTLLEQEKSIRIAEDEEPNSGGDNTEDKKTNIEDNDMNP